MLPHLSPLVFSNTRGKTTKRRPTHSCDRRACGNDPGSKKDISLSNMYLQKKARCIDLNIG